MASLKASDLPGNVDEAELRSLFGLELRSIQMPRKGGGENHGYAILDFDSQETADEAMERLNGSRLPNRKAVLKLAPCSRASGRPSLSSYQLCVGNLAPNLTDADLYTAMRSISMDVVGARVPIDKQNGLCKGYGFVRLSSEDAAPDLAKKAHKMRMAGRLVTVRECFPMDAVANGRVLFITNLDVNVTEHWIRKLMCVFGDVDFVHMGNNNVANCFARVGFADGEAASAAAALLQNRRQQCGRKMFFRWARPLSSDPQLQQFSSAFAMPFADERDGDEAREFAQSLLPMATPAERQASQAQQFQEQQELNAQDQARWIGMHCAPPGLPPSMGEFQVEEPASKRPRMDGMWYNEGSLFAFSCNIFKKQRKFNQLQNNPLGHE